MTCHRSRGGVRATKNAQAPQPSYYRQSHLTGPANQGTSFCSPPPSISQSSQSIQLHSSTFPRVQINPIQCSMEMDTDTSNGEQAVPTTSHVQPWMIDFVEHALPFEADESTIKQALDASEGNVNLAVSNFLEAAQCCGAFSQQAARTPPEPLWTPDQSPFRLFDLPPELRDHVFDHALVGSSEFKLIAKNNRPSDETTERPPNPASEQPSDDAGERPNVQLGLLASVKFRPSLNLSLCNKVLRQEYGKRSTQAMTLVLRDNEHYAFQTVTLPEQAKSVYWAELHLILFCHNYPMMTHSNEQTCQAVHEITQHRRWIENLLSSQLPQLRAFSIHAYLCYDHYRSSKGSKGKAPCESIIPKKILDLCDLPKLKELTLYKYEFSAKPDLDGPKVVLFEWPIKSRKDGTPETTSSEENPEEAVTEAVEDAVGQSIGSLA